jgi:twinkle protein
VLKNPRVQISAPKALNMREVYQTALLELGKPHPSIMLYDWPTWNAMTGGFRTREFTILCGSTGAGKTTFLANLSAQLLRQRVKHFVMSVETGHTDFMKRVMSVLAGRDLNTGEPISAEVLARVHAENAEYLESDTIEFSLYDNRVPVEQLMHDIAFMVDKGCKIAMLDNLNFFMEVTRSADQIIEMDRVIHELIIFCKQVDVHVVMVMHPKKTMNTRVESEFDIKGSSTAVQEAHNIFLFNRPKPEDVKSGTRDQFQRELTLAKMRRRGKYVGKTIVFDSLDTRYMEKGFA